MERSKRQKQYDLEALSYEDPSLYKALMQKQQSGYTPNQTATFGTIQEGDPTYRDNTKQKFLRNKDGDLRGIFNALGMDDYQARDLSERLFGGGPRNLGIGLLDFTGAGVPFGIQEGSRTYARGKNTDDNITKGLGAFEVALGFAEALPLAAVATKPLKLGIRSLTGKIKKLSGVDYAETVDETVDASRRSFLTNSAAAAAAAAIAPEILTGVVKSAGRIAPNVAKAASSLDLSVAKINALIKRKELLAQQADELRLDPSFSDSMQAGKRNDVTQASFRKDLESFRVENEIEQAALKSLDDLKADDFANAADDSIETIAEQFSNSRFLEDQIDNPAFDGLMEQVKLRGMNNAKDARGIDQFPYARSIFEDYYNPINVGGVRVLPSMLNPPVPKSLNMVRPVATDIKKGMTELNVLEINKRMQLREEKMIAEGNSASEIDAMKAELRKELYKAQGLPSDIEDFYADGGEVMNGIGSLNETARNMSRRPRGLAGYQQFAEGGEGVRPRSRPPEMQEMAEIRAYLGSLSDDRPRSRPEKYFEINSYDINGETQDAIDFKDGMRMFMPDVERMITSRGMASEPLVGRETGQEVLEFLQENNPTSEEFIDYFSSARLASGGEALGPPPLRGPDPQGIGAYQQFSAANR